eukprot:m.101490 g.101490  ORF g.101490 m.101490 type:complete len:613 (+) comp12576_c6_seq1:38-1876(+)
MESLVCVGTPVDIPDDEKDVKKAVPIDQQIVTDEEGRRRFHGAFTGGFSAGYYNTVGSKEGWTPSTFKSSRKEKLTQRSRGQQLEDFMDEEDFHDFGIAPKHVRGTKQFQKDGDEDGEDENGRKSGKRKGGSDFESMGDEALHNLVRMRTNTPGRRLLKLMGWKEGQGMGARLNARQQATALGLDVEEVDAFAAERGFTFAPRDVKSHTFKPKDNMFGIGYQGLSAKDYHMDGKQRMGAGFGVGAFEEEDEDIYNTDDRNNYDKVLGGAEFQGQSLRIFDRPGHTEFVSSSFRSVKFKKFPPPKIPPSYDPMRRARSGIQRRGVTPSSTVVSVYGKGARMDVHKRAALLGERVPSMVQEAKARASEAVQRAKEEEQQRKDEEQRKRAEVLSKVMAQRFTVGTGLTSQSLTEEEKQELKEQVDDGMKAARMDMFGRMTRRTYEWHPDRLVCKRFGVPDPFPRSGLVGVVVNEDLNGRSTGPTAMSKTTAVAASKLRGQSRWAQITGEEVKQPQPQQRQQQQEEEQERMDNSDEDDEIEVEPLPERPSMDLFKAIFSSDEDDEDEEEEQSGKDISRRKNTNRKHGDEKTSSLSWIEEEDNNKNNIINNNNNKCE